jgi:hypothetical protein
VAKSEGLTCRFQTAGTSPPARWEEVAFVLKSCAHASILPDGGDRVREESRATRVESQRSHSRGGGNPGFDDGREKLALTKVVAQEDY